jgi:hypothetical protein
MTHHHQRRVPTCGQPWWRAACGAPCLRWTCVRSEVRRESQHGVVVEAC